MVARTGLRALAQDGGITLGLFEPPRLFRLTIPGSGRAFAGALEFVAQPRQFRFTQRQQRRVVRRDRRIGLGFGGGYYDATLADFRLRKKILAVGVAYAQQACLFNLPSEDHDVRMDWVITQQQAYSF